MNVPRIVGQLLAAALAGCASGPSLPPPTTTAPVGEAIVIGIPLPPFVPSSPFVTLSNAFGFRPPLRAEITTQLIYNGLYRYDESLAPVPDLAAEPCDIADDLVTITCKIVDTTFHDGTKLTADDVAFTYELARRNSDCLFGFGLCPADLHLLSASALDERTVQFKLDAPNATFITLALPSIMIDSRAVVEKAYAPLGERAASLKSSDFEQASAAITAQLDSDSPDCEAPLTQATALFESAGLQALPRDLFVGPDGAFNSCHYAFVTRTQLDEVRASLGATGLDAISQAYPVLSFNRSPVGTGPFKFAGVEGGSTMKLEAFDGYHFGRPATPRIEVQLVRDVASVPGKLLDGSLDLTPLPPGVYEQVKDGPDLKFADFPAFEIYVLAYNLREGMLFADKDLRRAVELCIDKPATVDAATDGTGDVIYSPVPPVSWAYQSNLRHVERDVGAARALIEGAGWKVGSDGVYVRDGVRLATDVFVRNDEEQRVRFMDLMAAQERDCGIDFTVVPADGDSVLGPLSEFPHIPGGYDQPFQAVFLAFTELYDPHDLLWHSRSISSPEQPHGINFMGFSNAHVDELIDAGIATYDQRERARIYRELQDVLADDQPVLFAWSPRTFEALDKNIGFTAGQPNLSSPQWLWQLDKLILRPGS